MSEKNNNEDNKKKKKKSHAGTVFILLIAVIALLLLLIWKMGLGGGNGTGGAGNGDSSETGSSISETVSSAEETAESPAESGVHTISITDDKITLDGGEIADTDALREFLLYVNSDYSQFVLTDDHAIKSAYDDVKAVLDELGCTYSQILSDGTEIPAQTEQNAESEPAEALETDQEGNGNE